ncbi:MAG: GntR family transcriptional regulator [Rhizobiaceae bacterium]|nr:GntR family transcriptional regulator [Rhizobiaceae bacterium]
MSARQHSEREASGALPDSRQDRDDDAALNVQAYNALRERLLTGLYRPGSLLNTRPLAEEFGTSVMPVREALARLRSDGALEALPNRAFRVPVLREEVFRELVILRLRLEAAACECAAVRATAQDCREVASIYQRMLACYDDDLDEYLGEHRKLHFAIYEIAAMPLLKGLIERLWLRMGPLLRASSEGRILFDNTHHGAMVRALSASDPVALVSALRDDLVDSIEPICLYLRRLGSES